MSGAQLTACQSRALDQIVSGRRSHRRWLLDGPAGTGKSFLMGEVAREFAGLQREVVATAPTHKAVAVLRRRLADAGLGHIPCLTIHSLLSLRPVADGAGTKLVRLPKLKPPSVDAVIVDEASMVDAALLRHIDRWLPHAFVLYVGDSAQLPPVGEVCSGTFETLRRSRLETVVRQEAGNPVLGAAHAIRASQGGAADWSWCRPAKAPPRGVFLPGADADRWLHRAFTSAEFAADNDMFRYLCWTNRRVAEVNAKVRGWLYGRTDAPFVAGERVLIRQPVVRDEVAVFATNEEAEVAAVEADEFVHFVESRGGVLGWTARVPSWRVDLVGPDGDPVPVHLPRGREGATAVEQAEARFLKEATAVRDRWEDKRAFGAAMGKLQAVFALTVHNSQGSTYGSAFVDMADIRRRERDNLLECQQLAYVAATRPKTALMLVGVGEAA